MVNVQNGQQIGDYNLDSSENLNAIACRYEGEAWVVGDHGTLLYTNDGGDSWDFEVIPTTANIRKLATQEDGPDVLGGDGTFLVTTDTGLTWKNLGDGVTSFRSMSAAYANSGVLALDDKGGLWQYDAGALTLRASLPGARAVHQSTAGDIIMTAGNGIMRSTNGGATFQPLAVDPGVTFDDIRVADDGTAVAVGANGAIANIDAAGAVTLQTVGTASLHTIHIHHDTNGYAAGDDGTVILTNDSGLTWQMGPNVGRTVRGVDAIGFGHR
jgi:ligand-binding sensor domain-containing protein